MEIYDNEVYDGGAAGIFLHRSSDSAKVYGEKNANAMVSTTTSRVLLDIYSSSYLLALENGA